MDRQAELDKYARCYQDPAYKLGSARRSHIASELPRLPKGSLLDVGTGRGEVLEIAEHLGFFPVQGTETVDYLCDGERVIKAVGHTLPFADKAFDCVTMFDVMEHLLPSDTELVCKELKRVARQVVLLTVCNRPSHYGHDELHVNLRPSYEHWHKELGQHFSQPVEWLRSGKRPSEMFRINLTVA
jgi:ubiquinone/menaquinone biosynthesis C-methylase UbiE